MLQKFEKLVLQTAVKRDKTVVKPAEAAEVADQGAAARAADGAAEVAEAAEQGEAAGAAQIIGGNSGYGALTRGRDSLLRPAKTGTEQLGDWTVPSWPRHSASVRAESDALEGRGNGMSSTASSTGNRRTRTTQRG